jgi:hypothetical protein
LLAGNSAALTPAAADKPYFNEARIRAAQNTANAPAEPQKKIELLGHCLADFPRRNEARVPLFLAAASMRSDEFALAVLEPLLPAQFLGRHTSGAGAQNEAEAEPIVRSENEQDSSTEAISTASAGVALSRTQPAQVAETIGDAMTRLDRRADAVSYFEIARRSENSLAARRRLAHKIAAARAELRIQRENAARQPLLHEALEQDRVVRPRLLDRAAPPPKAAAGKADSKQGGRKP